MRRRLVVLFVAALATATAATGAQAMPLGGGPPTKEPGKLIVGFDLPAPGFVIGTATGTTIRNPRGFEVEMVTLIAKRLGNLQVEWLRVPFTGLFKPGPKPFDFAVEEATIKVSRARVVDFSEPYFSTNQGVMLSKGSPPVNSLRDLKKVQTCSQATTTGLDYILTKLRPTKPPLIYQTLSAAFKAVQVGTCDAIVMDLSLVSGERKGHPGSYGPIAGQIITHEDYGAIFAKYSPLRPFVDKIIRALRADGTLTRLANKWAPYTVTKVLK